MKKKFSIWPCQKTKLIDPKNERSPFHSQNEMNWDNQERKSLKEKESNRRNDERLLKGKSCCEKKLPR